MNCSSGLLGVLMNDIIYLAPLTKRDDNVIECAYAFKLVRT